MQHIQKELRELITISPEKAAVFFKTSVGEYAETEAFLGIKVPDLRALAKKHKTLSLKDLKYFLGSRFNEERLFAVIILVEKYRKADQESQEELFQFYLDNLKNINNQKGLHISL